MSWSEIKQVLLAFEISTNFSFQENIPCPSFPDVPGLSIRCFICTSRDIREEALQRSKDLQFKSMNVGKWNYNQNLIVILHLRIAPHKDDEAISCLSFLSILIL